ncbi:TadE/TadG family type IV pilus assembly protein [Nocardioides dongkuii]|uniref:TadE/TadG family type IV pilus assembly protein n=1 Tax=Nocardioides dongkuii TaxID=2760089 RepID=UPI0015FB55A8|nr:TadE/TadG family type IV pilus assembly protein [Nocardioides dongkuii]
MSGPRRRDERAAAVVDLVLVLVVLVPLVLGIIQVALVMHVRNTLAAAAAEGARYAATADRGPGEGEALTRRQIDEAVAGRFARDISVGRTSVGGRPAVVVTVRATVPALGLGGPGVELEVTGHAIEEQP